MVWQKLILKEEKKTRIHHTNAHLLQAALINVLGDEVKQAGSQVEEARTRLIFLSQERCHKMKLKLQKSLINNWIGQKLEVSTVVMSIEEAQKNWRNGTFWRKIRR